MSKMKKYTWILFAGLILSSCITTQSVTIDQMEPGKVAIPASVRKVALISRNFKFSVDTLSGYSKLDFRLRKRSASENQIIDSIGVTNSLDSLRKTLIESGRFDEVFVYPYNAIKPHMGEKEFPLSPDYIRSLCTESETQAVISLEMLSFFYSLHKGNPGGEIQPASNVKITAIWSVYLPGKESPVDRFTHSEVVRWDEKNPNNNGTKFKLPGRKEAVSIACGMAAKNYTKRIVPYWTESSRILVGLNGPEWDLSMSYAQKNKWKEAARIWHKYTASTQSRVAGVASLDYAIAQEMLGNMDKANEWSEKSVKMLQNGEAGKIARDYAAILYQRKLKAQQLSSLLK